MRLPALGFLGVPAIVLAASVTVAPAQVENPTFEAASVKVNRSGAINRRFGWPANRLEVINVPLKQLIAFAYGEPGPPPELRPDYQIAGGPDWQNSEMYDIAATTGTDVAPAQQKMLMLRALLADRFKLSVHHQMRDAPIYLLVLASRDRRLGPALRRSDVDCDALMAARGRGNASPPPPDFPCFFRAGIGNIETGAQTISAVTHLLSRLMDRPVVDKTELSGVFDLKVTFDPAGVPGLPPSPSGVDRPTSDAPSIFTALQEQLGLKLESAKGPVEVLVIDHVEHPSTN